MSTATVKQFWRSFYSIVRDGRIMDYRTITEEINDPTVHIPRGMYPEWKDQAKAQSVADLLNAKANAKAAADETVHDVHVASLVTELIDMYGLTLKDCDMAVRAYLDKIASINGIDPIDDEGYITTATAIAVRDSLDAAAHERGEL